MTTVASAPDLLDWVDFKWLMATEGHSVHLERLQADRRYALHCLQLGAGSSCATLRARSRSLLAALGG
ncbi:hypothetical protein [Azohydromonas sp.]|uniref:hypothetical protein n=1 Tax=Azohydromonas sp. TaxID=1872666 RepID=UPI002B9DC0DB|nr:hypothetical protein [Azohydromonas sp.]HMM84544.1 hypothetical protein [Azohydromonas sp.]